MVGGVLAFNGTNNGGLITSGTLDQNLNAGVTSQSVTGTYKVNSTGRGCMAITTSGTTITQHYRFSVNAAGTIAHVINFDTAGPFTSGHHAQTGHYPGIAFWRLRLRGIWLAEHP